MDEANGFGDQIASAHVILRHFRFLMSFGKVPECIYTRVRRHSFRHFVANVAHVRDFSDAKKSQAGRWANLAVMHMRYARTSSLSPWSTSFWRCWRAWMTRLARAPLTTGRGWAVREFLSPHASPPSSAVEVECLREADDVDGDDERSDEEDGPEPEGPSGAIPESGLPGGWTEEVVDILGERQSTYYAGPDGSLRVSRCDAWWAYLRSVQEPRDCGPAEIRKVLVCWDRLWCQHTLTRTSQCMVGVWVTLYGPTCRPKGGTRVTPTPSRRGGSTCAESCRSG